MTAFLSRGSAVELGNDATFAHDQDAIAHAQHLGQLGRDHDDGRASRQQLVHQAIDLDFGADVDASRRLIEEEDVRLRQQPLREHHLLLVAAGKIDHALACARGANAQRLDEAIGSAGAPDRRHETGWRWQLVRRGHGDVVGHGERKDQSLLLSILR